MKLSQVLLHGEYTASADPQDIEFSHIATHTSEISRGALFVCLRGTRYDSHTLLRLVEEGGAAAVGPVYACCVGAAGGCGPESAGAMAAEKAGE